MEGFESHRKSAKMPVLSRFLIFVLHFVLHTVKKYIYVIFCFAYFIGKGVLIDTAQHRFRRPSSQFHDILIRDPLLVQNSGEGMPERMHGIRKQPGPR